MITGDPIGDKQGPASLVQYVQVSDQRLQARAGLPLDDCWYQ
jgi:hypothetical protein